MKKPGIHSILIAIASGFVFSVLFSIYTDVNWILFDAITAGIFCFEIYGAVLGVKSIVDRIGIPTGVAGFILNLFSIGYLLFCVRSIADFILSGS